MAEEMNTVTRRFTPVQCADCFTSFAPTNSRQKRCQPCQFKKRRAGQLAHRNAKYHRDKDAQPIRLLTCERCGDEVRFQARKRFCEACKPIARAAKMREWAQSNPEKVREKARLHVERNREKVLARRAEARKINREAALAYFRSERRRSMVNAWERERRAVDPGYDISKRISHGIRLSISSGKSGRKWESLVGYSLDQLMKHIELQFVKGMNWQNRGDWHIDHIRPLSSFRFETPDCPGFKEAWALTNLRPLWSGENMSKGAKRLHLI